VKILIVVDKRGLFSIKHQCKHVSRFWQSRERYSLQLDEEECFRKNQHDLKSKIL